MCYTQLFNLLCEKADEVYGGRLPVHGRCLIDECANIGQIPKLEKLKQEIAKGEARLRRAQHEEKILEHQVKQLTRKERTHRLCTRGCLLYTSPTAPITKKSGMTWPRWMNCLCWMAVSAFCS